MTDGRSHCCANGVCDRRKVLLVPSREFHPGMTFPADQVWQDSFAWLDEIEQKETKVTKFLPRTKSPVVTGLKTLRYLPLNRLI
jgi:hypothetical protein